MKCFNFLLLLLLFTTRLAAQQNHFIYIQTENKQPFYVKMADQLFSSSSAGYLIIPKLLNGKYELGIGFPKNEWPLQIITVPVKNNDAGFVLKNFESKGWGLFNMQTMDIIMASAGNISKESLKESDPDNFADVLADVVSTPSIKQKTISKEVKEENVQAVSKPEPVEPVKNVEALKSDKPGKESIRPAVKLFSTIDTSGRSIVYADSFENETDTIQIFIPYKTKDEIKEKNIDPVEPEKIEPIKESKPGMDQGKVSESSSSETALQNPAIKTDPVNTIKKENIPSVSGNENISMNKTDSFAKAGTENKPVIMTNSDCKMNASGDDFLKLRKKMAAETTDDAMIAVAKKVFKSKCFSTEQVSNLSVLFLKDEGRYNFFDAAYPRISDSQNFAGLVSKLTDEYYITRFKAIIRH